MTDTTITDLIKAIDTTKTMVLAVDQIDETTLEIETKKIDLEQILNLFAVIGNEPPTGVVHIWPTDSIPTGYLELNGQTFSTITYPQLALIFPSGTLPDWRGRVPKHTPDGQSAQTTEEDQIKSHSHSITVSSKDLGTKSTSSNSHNHTRGTMDITGTVGLKMVELTTSGAFYDAGTSGFGNSAGTGGTGRKHGFSASRSWTGNTSTYSHSHTVSIGSHSHTASCATAGGTENTVKGVFVRYIVRAR